MFVGREKEIIELKELIGSKKPQIAVVYGRRRIGKSELISQCVKNKSVLNFEGAEGQSSRKQIKNFQDQFDFQLGNSYRESKPQTWKMVLLELVKELQNNPRPVILDEFQWMSNYRNELVSELKIIWDQYLKKLEGVNMILCGSIASFMIKKVLKSKALFGRVECSIHLKPFKLNETKKMFPGRGGQEILEGQLYTSGVPYYLELLSKADSVRLSLEKIAFQSSGYWVNEYQKIFVSHFGSKVTYQQIVETLSKNPYGLFRAELLEKLGENAGGSFSGMLFDLEQAGFISSWIPLNKSANSRLIKYIITDGFLNFYFSFIGPNLKKIHEETSGSLFQNITQSPSFYSWLGRSFEMICLQHAQKIAGILGFAGIDYNAGPYFKRHKRNEKGLQIDLVYQRKDNVITLCEMKYLQASVGMDVIDGVLKKEEILHAGFPGKTIQKVLITKSEPTKELVNSGFFWKIIRASELLN